MSAPIAEDFKTPVRRWRLTVEDFHRMGQAGIFTEDDRVELIDGELIEMPPIGPKHVDTVNRLNRLFDRQVGDDKLVSIQNPVDLDRYGEVYPDVTILRERNYLDANPCPSDVLLIIEVSDSTLGYDRDNKIPRYAAHAIQEVWIINVLKRYVEVYREPLPQEQRYASCEQIERGKISAQEVPEVALDLTALWPPSG
jgi:Uma2 family endonuclease